MKKLNLCLLILVLGKSLFSQQATTLHTDYFSNSKELNSKHSDFRTLYFDIKEKLKKDNDFPLSLDEFQYKLDRYSEQKEVPISIIASQNNNKNIIGFTLNKEVIYSNEINFVYEKELVINNLQINQAFINFDDGNGFIALDTLQDVTTITYYQSGTKNIQLKIIINQKEYIRNYPLKVVFNWNKTLRSGGVRSSLRLPHLTMNIWGQNSVSSSCDGNLGIAGGKAHVLFADSANKNFSNPLIFVEGLDLNKVVTYDSTYGDTIRFGNFGWDSFITGSTSSLFDISRLPTGIDTLLANGFDVVLLDFRHGADYVQKNSEVLIQLILQLNDSIDKANNCGQISVIGTSMGGIISRYALNKMEKNGIPHKVKTYISFDAPQQGANIPLGIQCFTHFFGLRGGVQDAKDGWVQLSQPAPVQLLPYHMKYYPDSVNCLNKELYDELKLDGYPTQTFRNVAISNGSGKAIGLNINSGGYLIHADWDPALINASFVCESHATSGVSHPSPNLNKYFYGKYDGDPLNLFDPDLIDTYLFPDTLPLFDQCPGSKDNTIATTLVPGILSALPNSSSLKSYEEDYSFISSISSLDINLPIDSLYYNIKNNLNTSQTLTPFDTFYIPDSNEYHVQITDDNFNFIKTQLLIPTELPKDSSAYQMCMNDSITVNNKTYTQAGVYFDTLNNIKGCDSIVIRNTISVNPTANVIANANNLNVMINQNIQFTASGSNVIAYKWYFGDGDSSFLNNPTHTYSSPGIYTVILKGTNTTACAGYDTLYITVTNSTSSIQELDKNLYSVYPNPTNGIIYIKGNKIPQQINIIDAQGKLIKQFKNNLELNTINLRNVAKGLYLIQIIGDNQQISNHYLVIN